MTCRRTVFVGAESSRGVLWSWPHERERIQREAPAALRAKAKRVQVAA